MARGRWGCRMCSNNHYVLYALHPHRTRRYDEYFHLTREPGEDHVDGRAPSVGAPWKEDAGCLVKSRAANTSCSASQQDQYGRSSRRLTFKKEKIVEANTRQRGVPLLKLKRPGRRLEVYVLRELDKLGTCERRVKARHVNGKCTPFYLQQLMPSDQGCAEIHPHPQTVPTNHSLFGGTPPIHRATTYSVFLPPA